MPRYKMIALTSAVPGKEAECDDWYQNIHLPEVVSYKGVQSAQRFKVAAELIAPRSWSSLTVYDIDTDDLGGLLGRIGADSAAGKRTMTDAADLANAYTVVFTEAGEVVTHAQAVAKVGEN